MAENLSLLDPHAARLAVRSGAFDAPTGPPAGVSAHGMLG